MIFISGSSDEGEPTLGISDSGGGGGNTSINENTDMNDNSRSSNGNNNNMAIYQRAINPEINREYPRIDSTYGYSQNIDHQLKDKNGSIDLYPIDYRKHTLILIYSI